MHTGLNNCQTFAKNYFKKLFFQNRHFLCFRRSKVKTQFSLRQKSFLVIETHLTPYREKLKSHKMTQPTVRSYSRNTCFRVVSEKGKFSFEK